MSRKLTINNLKHKAIPHACVRVTHDALSHMLAYPAGYPRDLAIKIDLCTLMAVFSINWQLNQEEVLYLLYNSLEGQALCGVGYEPRQLKDCAGGAYMSYMEPWGYRVMVPSTPIMFMDTLNRERALRKAQLERTRVKEFLIVDKTGQTELVTL